MCFVLGMGLEKNGKNRHFRGCKALSYDRVRLFRFVAHG